MRKALILSVFVLSALCINAQTAAPCPFEKLFNVTPGMDMPSAVTQLQTNNQVTLVKETSDKIPPSPGAGGDSVLHQTITYSIDSSECVKGKKRSIKFEFADGKLYKAFIESNYDNNEFAEMMVNFDFLHKEILKKWKYEKQVKISGAETEGIGYTFTKTQGKTAKLDMCLLQYIKTKGATASDDKYTLEIIWANLNNTRMRSTGF